MQRRSIHKNKRKRKETLKSQSDPKTLAGGSKAGGTGGGDQRGRSNCDITQLQTAESIPAASEPQLTQTGLLLDSSSRPASSQSSSN